MQNRGKRKEGKAMRDGIGRAWYVIICEREGSVMTPKFLVRMVGVYIVINWRS